MEFPSDLKYTADHEWARIEGGVAIVGITDYAQEQLGDVVYIELPEEGEELKKGDVFGVVESTKAASDLLAPVSGAVLEVNDPLAENPGAVNEDPYEGGWMIKVRMSDPAEAATLMGAEDYRRHTEAEDTE